RTRGSALEAMAMSGKAWIACGIVASGVLAAVASSHSSSAAGATLNCNMARYKEGGGLTAAGDHDGLVGGGTGRTGSEVRAKYAIDDGVPVVRDLSVRKQGGQWVVLGQNLKPEYHVVSGLRRMSSDHVASFPAAGIALTPDVVAKNRWYAFHDAPLE